MKVIIISDIILFFVSFLPPAYEVRGKVMFSLCPFNSIWSQLLSRVPQPLVPVPLWKVPKSLVPCPFQEEGVQGICRRRLRRRTFFGGEGLFCL